MSAAPNLLISLVTWNSRPYLPNLFASLEAQDLPKFRVTVVDNASQDGTLEWLSAASSNKGPNSTEPWARIDSLLVLRNFRNQGFSRGHNQAIALAVSHWPAEQWAQSFILVINPDLELAPACLHELITAMKTDASLAACGPKLLRAVRHADEDGHPEIVRSAIIDSTGLCMTRARRAYDRGAGEEDHGQYDQVTDVFGISGACMLLRASALTRIRLRDEIFDTDFMAYQEDVDLAWRLRRLGMKVALVPQAVAWHHRAASSLPHGSWLDAWHLRQTKSGLINQLSTRNHVWLLWKNETWPNFFWHSPWIVPYELAKCCAALFSSAVFKGYCAAVLGAHKMLSKRRELQRGETISSAQMRRWFV